MLLSRLIALMPHVILNEWPYPFIVHIFNICRSGVLTARYLVVAWLVPCESAAILAQVLCTPFNHAPVYSATSFKQSHIGVFICNLPSALLSEWPGSFVCYCSNMGVERILKIRVRKLTLEKKILLPLLWGLEPDHESYALTTELSPLPCSPSWPLLQPNLW